MRKLLYPNAYMPSVVDIRVDWLLKKGFKGILFDLDNTIVRRDSARFTWKVSGYIAELRKRGIAVGIVSNSRSRRVKAMAELLGVPAVERAAKPAISAFRRGLKMLGTKPEETVLVGDQIFTDVLGGNLAGIYTILVRPMPGKDFIGTKLITRPLERVVLSRLRKRDDIAYGELN